MCGRFTLTKSKEEISDYLASLSILVDEDLMAQFTPQYNIAPTHNVLVLTEGASLPSNQGQCQWLRWGLIPSWHKKTNFNSQPLINARQETLAQKPSFKNALRHRRCLILADGFYEWNQLYGKNPLYFHLPNHALFAFAGLWESWLDVDNNRLITSTTIINTSAEGVMKEIHPRMPVVLSPSIYGEWLNSQTTSDLNTLLQQHHLDNFSFYPVSEKVNLVKNNYANLLNPEKVQITKQLSLF